MREIFERFEQETPDVVEEYESPRAKIPIDISAGRFLQLKREALARVGNITPFINRRRGAILAFANLDLFSSKTRTGLKALYRHLPVGARALLDAEIATEIAAKSGNVLLTAGGNDRKVHGAQLKKVLILIVYCHNEVTGDSISLSEIDSRGGMQSVLLRLTGMASLGFEGLVEDFGNPQQGGVQALRTLRGFSTDPSAALMGLCENFSDGEKTVLRSWAAIHIRARFAGTEALRGRSVYAGRPILDVLYAIIDRHNSYHPIGDPLHISVESLRSKDTLLAELPKLNGVRQRPEDLADFSVPGTGGLDALRELEGYTVDAMSAIAPLLIHLPNEKRQALMKRIEARLNNSKSLEVALNEGSKSHALNVARVWDVMVWIVDANNEALPRESPYYIATDMLRTRAGMSMALGRLQRRLSGMQPDGNEAFCDDSNGVRAATRGVEGVQAIGDLFNEWIADFPVEERERLGELFARRLPRGAMSNSHMSHNAYLQKAMRDCIHWMAVSHNQLLERGQRMGVPANEDPRSSREIGETLYAITGRISLLDRALSVQFERRDVGGINAIRELRGYSRNLAAVFTQLLPPMSDESRALIETKIALRLGRLRIGSEVFLPGGHQHLSDRILDSLGYLIQAHNETARPPIDFSDLSTREGTSAILQRMQR